MSKRSLSKNKAGVSTVIATVLLILLTISIAVLLVQFLVPYVKNNLYKGTECVSYQEYFKFVQEIESKNYNCYQTGFIGASIKAETKESVIDLSKIKGFKIVYYKSDASEKIVEVNSNIPNNGEIITYKSIITAAQETKGFDAAEIYTLMKSGKICSVSDKIEIEICQSGIDLADSRIISTGS